MKSQLLLSVALLVSAISGHAATTLIGGSLLNGDFEVSTTGAVSFSSGTIANWATWTEQSTAAGDTGVYSSPTSGNRSAYLQPGAAIRDMTSYIIGQGDVLQYGFTDVLGARPEATMFLIYEDAGAYLKITGTDFTFATASGANNTAITAPLFTVNAGDAWIGKTLGVGFTSAGSYPEIDNANLAVIPEPSSAALLGLTGIALVLRRRK